MKDSKILAEQELRDIYYDPSKGCRSAERLYHKAKGKGLSVSRRAVRDWLKTQDTYTRYKPITIKHKVPKDLCERTRGPGATGPSGRGKVRMQEQGVPLDTNGR